MQFLHFQLVNASSDPQRVSEVKPGEWNEFFANLPNRRPTTKHLSRIFTWQRLTQREREGETTEKSKCKLHTNLADCGMPRWWWMRKWRRNISSDYLTCHLILYVSCASTAVCSCVHREPKAKKKDGKSFRVQKKIMYLKKESEDERAKERMEETWTGHMGGLMKLKLIDHTVIVARFLYLLSSIRSLVIDIIRLSTWWISVEILLKINH